jgi:hypothetical protein
VKEVALACATGSFLVALLASYFWFKASAFDLSHMEITNAIVAKEIETSAALKEWALISCITNIQANRLNRRAAAWTAVAVVLNAIATAAGTAS